MLSRGAKWILVTFIVLGVLADAGDFAVNASLNTNAYNSLVSAHDSLISAIDAAETQRSTCVDGLVSCTERYWSQLSVAFTLFRTSLSTISFPASDQADASRLDADTTGVIVELAQLVQQPTSGPGAVNRLQAQINTFESDYDQLAGDLL